MENNEFQKVCRVDELKNRIGKRVLVDDVDVAIFKIDEEIFAVSNVCPHQHAAIIYDGMVEEKKVVCPAHGWEFNLDTGLMASGRRGLDKYEVKVENEVVYVKVFTKELNW